VADIAYLRKHYGSLSDEALLDIDRAELTEVAQQCYDDELKERRMKARARAEVSDEEDKEKDEDGGGSPLLYDEEPDWADEGACACTFLAAADGSPSGRALDAQVALQAAGIPCNLATHKPEEEPEPQRTPRDEQWVMVPGNLVMVARSVLDKELFNTEVEEVWKSYFENLSDEELREADTKQLFCGLLDRLERLTSAYDEEKARRGV
jgi:hypothetical protein